MNKKLTGMQHELLMEGLRRFIEFKLGNDKLENAWIGLGYKSVYKCVVDAGMMEWVHGIPKNKCSGWLKLTDYGVKILQQWIDNGYDETKWITSKGWSYPVNKNGELPPMEINLE